MFLLLKKNDNLVDLEKDDFRGDQAYKNVENISPYIAARDPFNIM